MKTFNETNPAGSGIGARLMAVFKKEMRDHARDRRSLVLALIYPMLGPTLVAGALAFAGNAIQSAKERVAFDVLVVGAEYAPQLMAYIEHDDIRITPVGSYQVAYDRVKAGDTPVALAVPPGARGHDRFEVQMLMNLSRVQNLRLTARLEQVIKNYNVERARDQLKAEGLATDFATPITIKDVSVARQPSIAYFFYNMMPPLVIFMIFLGGVHLAIDTTVGERERGSLEPLLLAPVERWVLLLAKSLATLVFTAVTALVNLAAFRLFLGWAVTHNAIQLPPPGWDVFAAMFLVSIPLMTIAVALQMSIAVVTRSMKEAQIYLGLLPLVPALPGMVMMFAPINPNSFSVAVPVFGQMQLLTRLVMREAVPASYFVLATASTLLASALIFGLAAHWFRRERMFVLG